MNVVINRTDAIGDTLLTLPMAKFIKENYPGSRVAFIVSPKCRDIFINHPFVDECWVLNKKQNFYKTFSFLSKKFKTFSADTYFFAGGSHTPSFCAWIKGIKFRGGLKSKWQTFVFLNRGVRQSRSLVQMHESDYNLNLLKPLGSPYNTEDRGKYAPEIGLTEEEKQKALSLFREDLKNKSIEINEEIIVIHPGMTGHTLNWDSANYAHLILMLERDRPGRSTFVVSHTPGDQKFLEGLEKELQSKDYQALRNKVYFFNGMIRGLRDYTAFLSQVDLFVGPSTGTTHIANTLGVKMIGIYSPIKVQSSKRWGPFKQNKKTKIIMPEVTCEETFECAGKACSYYKCMDRIKVEDVFKSAAELLG